MGYTHYYRGWIKLEAVVPDVKLIVEEARAAGIRICGPLGEGPARITNTEIALNGPGDDGHESFHIVNGVNHTDGGFCKTARKPYDAVVGAVLLRVKAQFAKFVVESDGTWTNEEWLAARELYFRALGRWPEKPDKLLAD